MKSIMQRSLAIVLTCAALIFLPGCWDYEAINKRAAMIGLGIDPAHDDPEKIRVTIQVPILHNGQSQGEGSAETSKFQDLSGESYSLMEAIRTIQTKMDRQADVAQLRVIVLSSQLSGETMDSVLGQLMRLTKINRLAYIFMTPGSAEKVMATEVSESAPMNFVEKSVKVKQHGYVVRRQLWEYWRDTTQLGVVPMIPILTTEEIDDKGKKTLAMTGEEVYLNNKPALALSRNETLYVNLLMGKVRDMSFDIPIGQGVMTLTDMRAKSHVRCIKKKSEVVLADDVTVAGTLAKHVDPSPKPLPPTNINELQLQASIYLTQQLTDMVVKLQQQQTDVVGFGRNYLQAHPEEEARLKQQWSQMFGHAKLDIQVKVAIRSKGGLI
ncbi:Ger(x)C family spore germination protein [Alicyclobacillus sp. ALC3]|uniref:Ger(x)C family spore germination protein n=1 Tax=Alicyclobacillus sp. ALC3 TaxID=2796143 RepID=UPI00237881CF|nr:Ger(x)C family spore germination protein [Alicyclobacillus sp. ALC3]WDL98098.1 Ger(x)C family spore germination protein [Alicyclobacillus sp. ALC3]